MFFLEKTVRLRLSRNQSTPLIRKLEDHLMKKETHPNGCASFIQRRERDSNPRSCYRLRFSRPAQSTTLTSLRRKAQCSIISLLCLLRFLYRWPFLAAVHSTLSAGPISYIISRWPELPPLPFARGSRVRRRGGLPQWRKRGRSCGEPEQWACLLRDLPGSTR